MRSILAELRRRNVFRVGIGYAIVAWLMLQLADVLIQLLALPDWIGRTVVLLLVLGFPIALILAWAFEFTSSGLLRDTGPSESQPPQRKNRDIVSAFALIALGVLLVLAAQETIFDSPDNVVTSGESTATASQPNPGADPGIGSDASIAVLAFANMSNDPTQAYFSDGISEELLNALAGIPGLRVASRTSAFAFKGESRNIRDIAEILDVRHIVEGSVRKSGETVRITAQLIDTQSDSHLWSETFDRELTDIFAVQEEIARNIVSSLEPILGVAAARTVDIKKATTDVDAYDLYLQALSVGAILSRDNKYRQIELLEQAVARDPDFSVGLTQLAFDYSVMPTWDHSLDMLAYQGKAKAIADRAQQIDPHNAEIYLTLANIAFEQKQWQEWQRLVTRAMELDSVMLGREHLWAGTLAQMSLGLGYAKRALEIADEALLEWPDVNFLHLIRGIALVSLGRTDESMSALENSVMFGYAGSSQEVIYSHLPSADRSIVWTAAKGDELLAYDPELLPLLPHMRRLAFAPAARRVEEMERFWRVAGELGFSKAELLGPGKRWGLRLTEDLLVPLGEFERIADAYWGNSPMFWMWTPALAPFRASDAFRSRVRESGMLAFWQENGWPDLCTSDSETEFRCK
jgi:TolB-like protein